MLASSKTVLFLDHNHLPPAGAWAIMKVLGHQNRWLAGDYDMEIGYL